MIIIIYYNYYYNYYNYYRNYYNYYNNTIFNYKINNIKDI